ncbi:MAG: methionyl-tRNA formyltransferase [Acetivibrionales bacterium]|jgi:methionyl-tRNA formyltransferase
MRVLFMGTPYFAVPSLKALIKNNYEIVGVVTQEDRPKGRGHMLQAPPVKECAKMYDIPVLQPRKISKEPEIIHRIAQLNPDLIVTCAFGQILPQSLLDIPKYGTINVHGSLLPKYRGAAPIQWAIINGDEKTGITTMFTELGLDTGDMLLKEEITITIDMTTGELHDIMSELGAKTLIKTIKALEDGTLVRTKQDESLATYAPKIDKHIGIIDWSQTTLAIHNKIRGTNPWPGAQSTMCGKRFKICCSRLADIPEDLYDKINDDSILPGTILKLVFCDMWVKTGDGALLIHEIQAESCKRMTPQQYACGHDLKEGMIFC